MITTVTLNAAIDKTYYLDDFTTGQVWRVKSMRSVPGGKGINVARVIQQLGKSSFITGIVGGNNGEFICTELDHQGLQHEFIKVSGESRINLNIMEKANGSSTEILEPGPTIESDTIDQLKMLLKTATRVSKVFVFSGSLPPGAPVDLYRELIEAVQEEGAQAILDTSGHALVEGLKAKPYMIKPNEDEMRMLTGLDTVNEHQLFESIRQLMGRGIACVAVSLGARGAAVGFAKQLFLVHAPQIQANNPVGCGDSFTAGFAVGLESDLPIETCLLMAAAAGAANAMTEEAGNIRIVDYERFLKLSKVEKITPLFGVNNEK